MERGGSAYRETLREIDQDLRRQGGRIVQRMGGHRTRNGRYRPESQYSVPRARFHEHVDPQLRPRASRRVERSELLEANVQIGHSGTRDKGDSLLSLV